jgi:hypothetical protein
MNNNRLGCFSLSAIVTALLTLAVVVGILLTRGNGMFSPGSLNAASGASVGGVSSHAEIGGECGLCHTAPWDSATMAERCADCHASVRTEWADPASLHGAIRTRTPGQKCTDCHSEHQGSASLLTRVEGLPFPHDTLGYFLTGHKLTAASQPFVCADCHVQDLSTFDSATCIDCHRNLDLAFTQAHELSWGGDCLGCHDGVDTYNKHFDHGKVPFALMGAHVKVDCYTCHTDARSLVDLKSAPQDCSSCHQKDEPHEGRFGADCTRCHTMDAWTPATFDHSLAAFQLEGKHADVACEDCHMVEIQLGTPKECFACHAEDDKHEGDYGEKCDLCHKPTGWDDDPFDHNKSKLPLIGGHLGVTCESCHKDGQFTNMTTSCFECHGYPSWHGSALGANCTDCHTVDTWYRLTQGIGHPWWSHPEEGIGMGNCRSCHPSTVYQSYCGSCHDKNGGGGD